MKETTELRDPPESPRVVPLSRAWGYAWVGILVAGILSVILLVLLVGGFFLLAGPDPFGSQDARLDRDNTYVASGRVVTATTMPLHVGRRVAIRYEFEYTVGEEQPRAGICFGWSDGRQAAGARVAVEYLPSDHAVARIVDTNLTLVAPWVWGLLLAGHLLADLVAAVFLLRALRRKALAETGRATPGRIVAVVHRRWINPPPAIVTYECNDPTTGTPIRATQWLRGSKVALQAGDVPAPCHVAVADDFSGRSVLLAMPGWEAWEAGSSVL